MNELIEAMGENSIHELTTKQNIGKYLVTVLIEEVEEEEGEDAD